jgi:hypothetical protein
MRTSLLVAAFAFAAGAAQAGVSISVNEPGVFGRIDISNLPMPHLLFPKPLLALPQPPALNIALPRPPSVNLTLPPPPAVMVAPPQPIYLRVPPTHAEHWREHCREYNACGQPVYFVREDWYNEVYAPAHRHDHGRRHEEDRRDWRGDDHGRHGDWRDQEHDRGRGHGHGHDRD